MNEFLLIILILIAFFRLPSMSLATTTYSFFLDFMHGRVFRIGKRMNDGRRASTSWEKILTYLSCLSHIHYTYTQGELNATTEYIVHDCLNIT